MAKHRNVYSLYAGSSPAITLNLEKNREEVSMIGELEELVKKLPSNYYFCEKALWCGDNVVDVDHIDNDLNKPLDYVGAVNKMIKLLN